jgi:hypothetical protein
MMVPAPCRTMMDCAAGRVDRAHVGIEHAVVERGIVAGERRARLLIAGVVERHVEAAVVLQYRLVQARDVAGLGDICRHEPPRDAYVRPHGRSRSRRR